MSRIQFQQINKRYAGNALPTIHNANIDIAKGEFCVFVGPSGCGKSTLLRMVAGLEEITSGDLLIGGRRVNDLPPAKRGLAMVFQSYALYPHMTVAENMAFGLRVLGSDKAAIDEKVRRAAEILQLTPLLARLPKQLSGGQRQRVAIGRAIVKEPQVFLFDEPLSNLDAALRVQTRLEIAKLHQDIGTSSMIYVTHDQVEAMTLADKIVLLRSGKDVETLGSIAQFGSPMELYHRPENLFVAEFIGSPKMNVMAAKLTRAETSYAIVELWGKQITVSVDARSAAPGVPVWLGIRPEHLSIADTRGGSALEVSLYRVERLGNESLLYLDAGPDTPKITLLIDGHSSHRTRDRLSITMHPESCHLFDIDGCAFRRTIELPA